MGWPPDPTDQRFWTKVRVGEPAGCWPWTAANDGRGRYGQVRRRGRKWGAHQWVWVLTYGEIPKDMTVDHKCFNPPCCNPAHLRLLSWDEQRRNQRSAYRTHCKRGHEYTPENTIPSGPQGKNRNCRTCSYASKRRRRPPVPPKTHCKYGHPLSGDNLYISKRQQRRCRECSRRHLRDGRARRKAAKANLPPPDRSGINSPSARLTAAQVLDIRTRHSTGQATCPALAAMFGTNRSQIQRIVNRQAWRTGPFPPLPQSPGIAKRPTTA
jgi:HNH endonuclease